MTQSQSLLEFLHGLISDGAVRARFSADPAETLASGGVVATSPQAVYEALVRMGDDQDLGRSNWTLHIPPPPPPAYFGDQDAHSAGIHYLDNYVTSSFDDDQGPFTGDADAHAVEPAIGGYPSHLDEGEGAGDAYHAEPDGVDAFGHDDHGAHHTVDSDFGSDLH